jgi:dienelactone hydrolase
MIDRRSRILVGGLAACLLAAAPATVLTGCGGGGAVRSTTAGTPEQTSVRSSNPPPTRTAPAPAHTPGPPTSASGTPARRHLPRPPFAVGLRVLTFIDRSRLVRVGGALVPRKLVTLVRYPATGPPTRVDVAGAPAERDAGPFPLVVFGHGFAVTPTIYASLLQAWARAGYVVAAPIFPLENANAPGGPNESDLINQPGDMSFVISGMLAISADPGSVFARLIDPHAIAVTGQSDGGETALAAAYDRQFLDRRVRAAVILSGAEIPGVGGFDFPAPSPPLLATQGTADVINPSSLTLAFFDLAPRPKYLLSLLGAPHLGPYTNEQPQLGVVERVTIAFLDRYLKHAPGAGRRLLAAGHAPNISVLHADP